MECRRMQPEVFRLTFVSCSVVSPNEMVSEAITYVQPCWGASVCQKRAHTQPHTHILMLR